MVLARWCAALTLASPAPPAVAAVVLGHVDVRLPVSAPHQRPSVAALGMPSRAAGPDRRRSVVYLETAPRGAFEPPPSARARLDQRGESFVPYVLPVAVGTTVDFPNSDPVFHNVFSLSKTQSFDLGRYAAGRSKWVRFERPGIVRVFCDIHSHMTAYILVFAHRYFAATDAAGRFAIPDVPAGRYVLLVWTDGEVRERREIAVAEADALVRADFVVE